MSAANFTSTAPVKLMDMREGYEGISNVLGFSDPSVHFVEGRWTMFVGGLHFPSLKTNIFTFELPEGAPLSSPDWRPKIEAGSRKRAERIVDQPAKGSWDRFMHSVCYVRGLVDGEEVERIYHAGRNTEWLWDEKTAYRIGFMEKRNGRWECEPTPLPLHSQDRPSVLEPKVEYLDGKWSMRFLSIPMGLTGEDWPDYTLFYCESDDGVSWTTPSVFSTNDTNQAGYFDSVLNQREGDGIFTLALTRDSNLSAIRPYPAQGVWLSAAGRPFTKLEAWPAPQLVVDPAEDADGWYANGMCSPTAQWGTTAQDSDTLYIFFVAATEKQSWFKESLRRLASFRRPPVPAPFYFTIGRVGVGFSAGTE